MKTKQTIIAASVALMLSASYGASAAQKPVEYHEGQWDSVMSYSKTSIAKDSSAEWGPWADFVQPAAGAPSVAFLPQGVVEAYRPLPQVNVPVKLDDFCKSGEWCGYAAYIDSTYSYQGYGGEGYGGSYTEVGHNPGRIALKLSPEGEGGGTAAYRIQGLPGEPTPLQGESGTLPASFYGTPGNFYASQSDSNRYAWIDGGEGGGYYDTNYITHGNFSVREYMSGGDGGESSTIGSYVAGIVTSKTDIAALQAGNVQATYSGYTVYPHSGHNHFPESPVQIAVNFGNSTWSGSWNNGVDGYVHTHSADAAGTVHLYGQVGFTAAGNIQGANIVSTTVGTNDRNATVTGKVQGSFFGANASALAGVSDITKSNPDYKGEGSNAYTKARNVDLFITQRVKTVTSVPK